MPQRRNAILSEHLDLSNRQMVNSKLLCLDAISYFLNDLFPCIEATLNQADYSTKYYSTRAIHFRDLWLSDLDRPGLQLVKFMADCLLCYVEPLSYEKYLMSETLEMSVSWDCLHPQLGRIINSFDADGPTIRICCHSTRHLEDQDSSVPQVRIFPRHGCRPAKLHFRFLFLSFFILSCFPSIWLTNGTYAVSFMKGLTLIPPAGRTLVDLPCKSFRKTAPTPCPGLS
jgi:hypothetical protein